MANLPGSSTGFGMTDFHKVESGAAGNAASTHTASDTTIELQSGQGSQFPTDSFAVFVPDTDEWLWVSGRSSDTLTVDRDLNGNADGGKEIPNDAEIRLVLFENPVQTLQEEVEYLTKAVLGENQLDVTIQATTADGSTSPLTLQDSAASVLFDVDSNGVVTANGAVTVNDTVTVADGTGTDAVYAEDGVDRSSASAETFNVQNSGTGAMTLQQDGTAVVIETRALTGGDGIQAIGDLSTDRTIAVAAADIAGSGLTTEGAPVDLAVGSGTGITVNAGDVAVDTAAALTWTAAQTFNGGVTMGSTLTIGDNQDIAVGSTNGTQIATAATQLLGFFGATPVAQQTAPQSLTDNSGGTTDGTVAAVSGSGADATINDNFAELAEEVNAIRDVLVNLGLAA